MSEVFSVERPVIVTDFTKLLRALNRGSLLNGMDERCFSLSLECQQEHSFRVYAALKLYLKEAEVLKRFKLISVL
jgi:hypothetical protein